jgi:hypothetical protein
LCALFLGSGLIPAQAAEGPTPEEAKAMAIKAGAFLKANGPEKAFAAINDKAGPFRDRDLYVFVHDTSGLVKAHGGNAALIGKNTVGIKDVDGKAFVKAITEVKGDGWVDYKWQNPETKAVEPKTVYVVEVDGILICAGAYKKVN